MILSAKSAACWCFLAALWYFKVAEIVLNPLCPVLKKVYTYNNKNVSKIKIKYYV